MSRGGVAVVCAPPLATAFRLAGLATVEADSAAAGADRLARLLEDPGVAVVFADEAFIAALPDEARARLARRALPLVAAIPAAAWDRPVEAAEEYLAEVLRQAIGYRVRLR